MKKNLIIIFTILTLTIFSYSSEKETKIINKTIQFIKKGKHKEAYILLDDISNKNKDYINILYGIIYEKTGDYLHAIQEYKKVIDLYESKYLEIAYIRIIACYDVTKKYKLVIEMIDEYLAFFPHSKYKQKLIKRKKELKNN